MTSIPGRPSRRLRDDDIIIEFIHLGRVVRVSAIDQVTGTEVSIVGDPRAGKEVLSRLAARKLRYVLARRKKGAGRASPKNASLKNALPKKRII